MVKCQQRSDRRRTCEGWEGFLSYIQDNAKKTFCQLFFLCRKSNLIFCREKIVGRLFSTVSIYWGRFAICFKMFKNFIATINNWFVTFHFPWNLRPVQSSRQKMNLCQFFKAVRFFILIFFVHPFPNLISIRQIIKSRVVNCLVFPGSFRSLIANRKRLQAQDMR